MPSKPTTDAGYRLLTEVSHHAAWLYHLCSLSLRDIELILAERGVPATGSIRRWRLRFGAEFAPSCAEADRGQHIPSTWMRLLAEQAQRFLSPHGMIYGHSRSRRHLMTADQCRRAHDKALQIRQQQTCVQLAA
jgi:putative transposase